MYLKMMVCVLRLWRVALSTAVTTSVSNLPSFRVSFREYQSVLPLTGDRYFFAPLFRVQ